MDVHALDDKGVHYNIAIQNNPEGASIERADYNGAAMKAFFFQNEKKEKA